MTKKAKNELFSSILYIIVGAVLAIFQSQTLGWAMTIVGAFFIISGALDLIKQNWVGGGVSAAIGIAILVLGWLAVDIVLLVLGILMAIKGFIALIEMLKAAMKDFSPIEKKLIAYRFQENLSQTDTANRLGVTQMFVSRTERRLKKLLKERLQEM